MGVITPYVSITNGAGTGATAIANMVDDGTGKGTLKIGSITITNPGNNYTGTGTVTLTGGGGSGATFNAITFGNNNSGGITFQGAGTTTLTGANTYAGGTTISNGTVNVGGGGTTGSLGTGSIVNNSNLVYSYGAATDMTLPTNTVYSGTGTLSATARNIAFAGNLSLNGGAFSYNATGTTGSLASSATTPIITAGSASITGDWDRLPVHG